jgi:hypothetical protein
VYSLARTFENVAVHLAPSLVAPAALAGLREITDHLPAALSSCIYLERWLRRDASHVDLIVRVSSNSRSILAGQERWLSVDGHLRARPAWQKIEAFARAWGDPRLEHGVDGLWLEFDRSASSTVSRDPFDPRLFVDFRREVYRQESCEARQELLLAALRPLRGGSEPSPEMAEQVRRCLARLPPKTYLPYIGLALEDDSPLRLCVMGLTDTEILQYLYEIGWPGDRHDLTKQVLAPFGQIKDRSPRNVGILHIDIDGRRVSPRIGLEYAFSRASQRQGRVTEESLLQHLVDIGSCDAAVRDDLRRWPGESVEMVAHEIWHCRVVRRLSHVKVTYGPGEPLDAKAYFCFFHALHGVGTMVGKRPVMFGQSVRIGAEVPIIRAGARIENPVISVPERQTPVRSVIEELMAHGRRVATYRNARGGRAMTMSMKEQQVLEAVLQRATEDAGFRGRLLTDPRAAILEAFAVKIPANFRVKFIEKGADVDALVVLPDFHQKDGELSDRELEAVAGGADSGNDQAWVTGS